MEKQLKCVLLLPLKEMALRRVAVTVWSGTDILASVSKVNSISLFEEEVVEKAIEDEIKDKILKLGLPTSLIKQMSDIVRLINLEARKWKREQISYFQELYNTIALPDSVKFCWTTSGTINFKQTAEQLLRCDELDFKQRYEIACHYCLEDSISLYWEELSEEEKGNYGKNREERHLLRDPPYWFSCILKGERSELDYLGRISGRNLTSFHQFAFECSAAEGYRTAAEYFFQKLTAEEREASLMRTAHAVIANDDSYRFGNRIEKRSNLLCYLLSVMTPEQQMEIIQSYPVKVFLCFLHWPLQDLFSDNASLLWTFLPPSRYRDLVGQIYRHSICLKTVYFVKIFKEFFMSSPLDFKKWFVDGKFDCGNSPGSFLLDAFFAHEKPECIKVMLRSLDAADRVKLVFQRRAFGRFCIYVLNGSYHLVEVCLREATLSKEEQGRLQNDYMGFFTRRTIFETGERGERKKQMVYQKLKSLFECLGETDASSSKREKGVKRALEDGSPEQCTLSSAGRWKATRI